MYSAAISFWKVRAPNSLLVSCRILFNSPKHENPILAKVSGVVTTIGSNFEKRWLEKRGSCAKILADLMHNTSGKLQRNDFMDHVAYSSEGVLQQVA